MKSLIIAFSLFITAGAFSLSMTNILGTSGQYIVKESNENYRSGNKFFKF